MQGLLIGQPRSHVCNAHSLGLDGELPVEEHVGRGAASSLLVHLEDCAIVAQVPGVLALHI